VTRTLPKGVFKRGNVYAVRFSVPAELQPVVGKREIVRSLGTSDLGEALSCRSQTLAEIRSSLFADDEPKVTPEGKTLVLDGSRREEGTSIRETAHRWLTESDGVSNTTRHRYRYILEKFERFTSNADVSQINRGLALRYIEHLKTTRSNRTGKPLSQRSLFIHQSCLASYWGVLDHWGLVDPDVRNPFSSLLKRVAGQRKKPDPRKKTLRPVTREEANRLLRYIEAQLK
jgi:hypothetical protein